MLSNLPLGKRVCVDGDENFCGTLEREDEENIFLTEESEIVLPLKRISSIYWHEKESYRDVEFLKNVERIKRKARIVYCCMILVGTVLGMLLGVVT